MVTPSDDVVGAGDDVIADGLNDIAKRFNLEEMCVEATGHKPFQKVYLWTEATAGKATTKQYNPKEDGLAAKPDYPKLPTDDELCPSPNDELTKQYLEVGLVIAEEPTKWMNKGKMSRSKEWDKEKEERGLNLRGHVYRVFTPVTEHIAKQAKFYVGCKKIENRLSPRIVKQETVFFYPEYWRGISNNALARDRTAGVVTNCKKAAAKSQTEGEVASVRVVPDQFMKQLTQHPAVITVAEDLKAKLKLLHTLYEETQDEQFLDAMIRAMDDARPDLKYRMETQTAGAAAFMEFEEDLEDEEAVQLAQELTAMEYGWKPSAEIIKKVHAIIRLSIESDGSPDAIVGYRLSPPALGFFLGVCHKNITMKDDEEKTLREVQNAIDLSHLFKAHVPRIPARLSRPQPAASKSGNTRLGREDLHTIIVDTREYIATIIDSQNQIEQNLVKEHSGLTQHGSLQALRQKIVDSLDVSECQGLLNELETFLSCIFAARPHSTVQMLEWLHMMLKDFEELLADPSSS